MKVLDEAIENPSLTVSLNCLLMKLKCGLIICHMFYSSSRSAKSISISLILVFLIGPLCSLSSSDNDTDIRILVVVPETIILRPAAPDPAAETEIINGLLKEHYLLVDQNLITGIRYTDYVVDAYNNDSEAINYLYSKYNIDVLIIGEAFSEEIGEYEGIISFKARLEVKIIVTSNKQIIMSESVEATGLDVTSLVAGKKALKNAGKKMTPYIINALEQHFH